MDSSFPKNCSVCGHSSFLHQKVLWPALYTEWELHPHEIDYIDKQQGTTCEHCGCNLRSQVLAAAICRAYHSEQLFQDFVKSKTASKLRVLEINQAGHLCSFLSYIPHSILVEYPEYDMMNLDFPSKTFDLVIHSETLEHIPDPLQGLKECYRVLKQRGHCIFTIPVIVDRVTRSRTGLPNSYHGNPEAQSHDMLVHSEFGCDSWKLAFEAGFNAIKIQALDYPSALAFSASKFSTEPPASPSFLKKFSWKKKFAFTR